MNYETPSGRAARAIRGVLAERRESIEALACGSGIAHTTLKRRLLLISPFTIDELSLIADHFGMPVESLLLRAKAVA